MASKKVAFTVVLILAIVGMLYTLNPAFLINKTPDPIEFVYKSSLCATFIPESPSIFNVSSNHTHYSGQILSSTHTSNLSTSSSENNISVPRKIFLMETSGKNFLNARQACAVESAARRNSEMQVVVYFVSPTVDISNREIISLAEMPNVSFQYLNLDKYFNCSPLITWYKKEEWKKSSYKVSHMSDALRFLTLWKYGGIYLDLDVVVIKSLAGLKNCAGKESKIVVAPGVMSFDREHSFLSECLREFSTTYSGAVWGWNGPHLITRVLKRYCGQIKNLDSVSREKCNGVTILPPSAFYALKWEDWQDFFNASKTKDVMEKLKDSYLSHVWNKHSSKKPVKIGSGQAYEVLAKQNCPSIYALQKDTF